MKGKNNSPSPDAGAAGEASDTSPAAPEAFLHPSFERVTLLEDLVLPAPLGFSRAGGTATLRRETAAALVADGMGAPAGPWTVGAADLLAGIGRLLGDRSPAEFDTKATEAERRRMRRLIDGMGER